MRLNLSNLATGDVAEFKSVRLLPDGSIVAVFSSDAGEVLLSVHNGDRVVGKPQPNGDLIWVEEGRHDRPSP